MPDDSTPPADGVTCPICGTISPAGSTKCDHCYSSLKSDGTEVEGGEPGKENAGLEALRQIPGVGEAKAETLHEAGYRSVEDVQRASVEELSSR